MKILKLSKDDSISKLKRRGLKVLKTSQGLEFVSDKIGYKPPPRPAVEILTYKGHSFPAFKDSPDQVLSPKRQYKKRMREAEREAKMRHGKNNHTS